MATVTKKSKDLNVEEKIKALREIEYGKKKGHVCLEFGVVQLSEPNEVTAMRRCVSD
jgi:hypothetical protein